MKTIPAEPRYLRAVSTGRPVKVDREAKVLRGYVVAQAGPFKDGRGEFNAQGLSDVVRIGNAERGGLRSHFTHADLSSDGLGKFLGRSKNFAMDSTTDAAGKSVKAVRGDLFFDETAFKTPNGDLATYVMDLAESDPGAISSSLVIIPREEEQLDDRGRIRVDGDGEPLPPLWFPEKLKASDIVSDGAAVDGLLSVDFTRDLDPDDFVRLASRGLDHLFADQSREVIEARCHDYLNRYLARRFGGLATDMMPGFAVGDRVRVKQGMEHGGGMGGMGVVREVSTPALGIELDSMPGQVHHWYVADELEAASGGGKEMTMKVRTPRLDAVSIRFQEMELILAKLAARK